VPGDDDTLKELLRLSKKTSIPLVATNSTTFLSKEDYKLHRTLVAIQRVIHHRNVEPVPSDHYYLKTEEEMKHAIGVDEAIENAGIIGNAVDFELPLGTIHPPIFSPNDFSRLITLTFANLPRRYSTIGSETLRRLWRELTFLGERGFASYFLIVHEIIQWARSQGIQCSIRGSAVGSIVSFLLFGGLDPIKHNLLFERFLNEGRFDAPDIDVDFDSERREEVLTYIFNQFSEKAALVATVPTFRARSALRETARVLGYSYETIDTLTQFLPYHVRPSDIPQAIETLPELYNSPLKKEPMLLRVASGLDGLPRQLSVHLGGVAISEKLLDLVPLQRSPRGFPVCQFDKDDIELLGLAKFDILGLRMHTAVAKTIQYIREQGRNITLDSLPLDDPKTYRLLNSADTVGVFQVESPGQRQLLGRVRPECFSDIIAEISLFRPGPMQADMIDPFIKRKHGREHVDFLHPWLEEILRETYGVLIYQEQVLKIVAELTGAGLDWADVFRRSMTKDRTKGEMASLREEFIRRCLANGITPTTSEEAFRQVSAFAAYGFCKAHAVSFALITYQSAYLKAHWPLEFYLGLLNSGQAGSYPERVILNEARRQFSVYPPHVNRSYLDYTREHHGIRVGMGAIKGIGSRIADRVVSEREYGGTFRSVKEFRERSKVSRGAVNALFRAGALEGLRDYGQKAA
jgi:DNA-directed DNA polymerase III PolC